MKKISPVIILIMIAIFVLITAVGFLLLGDIDDRIPSGGDARKVDVRNKDEGAALFADFKAGKEKILEQSLKNNPGDMEKPRTLSEERQVYCWDKESGTYEKRISDFNEVSELLRAGSTKTQSADLNGNSIEEEYILQSGKLIIQENAKTAWQSADDWWVEDFALADSNNDGVADINLSVWKSGSFGRSKPFWIKKDDPSVRNHFFVFDFKDGKMQPVWQSSNLDASNCRILVDDVNADGENELIVLEGDYADAPTCRGKYIAVWKWGEWGFGNEWRSEEGEFKGTGIFYVGKKKCFFGVLMSSPDQVEGRL